MLVTFCMSTRMPLCLTLFLTRLFVCLTPLLTPRHPRRPLECLFTVVEFWTALSTFAFAFLIDLCALKRSTVNAFLFVEVVLLLGWLNALVGDTPSLTEVTILAGTFPGGAMTLSLFCMFSFCLLLRIRPFAIGHWIINTAKNVDSKVIWKKNVKTLLFAFFLFQR